MYLHCFYLHFTSFERCKDSANRKQNKMNLFIFYAEVPLASSKGGVFREFPINLWGKSAAWDKIRRYLCDVKE
ncbi:hypothetical protein GAO29_30470 [Bacteroides thetaiotaomicron]|nr:hypothetical protein GAO29_30470 [Bacteroides thetaiotaomicron]